MGIGSTGGAGSRARGLLGKAFKLLVEVSVSPADVIGRRKILSELEPGGGRLEGAFGRGSPGLARAGGRRSMGGAERGRPPSGSLGLSSIWSVGNV